MTKIPDSQALEDIKTAIDTMKSIVMDVERLLELSGHTHLYGKSYRPIDNRHTMDTLSNLSGSFDTQIVRIKNIIEPVKTGSSGTGMLL